MSSSTTTMGLLHDTRHFQFASDTLRWDELGDIPLDRRLFPHC